MRTAVTGFGKCKKIWFDLLHYSLCCLQAMFFKKMIATVKTTFNIVGHYCKNHFCAFLNLSKINFNASSAFSALTKPPPTVKCPPPEPPNFSLTSLQRAPMLTLHLSL